MIKRILQKTILQELNTGKILVIYGPRQTGKTTLLHKIFDRMDAFWINGDNIDDREKMEVQSANRFSSFLKDKHLIIIDEGQRIQNIGLNLKIIHDQLKIQLVVTGSSSFDLSNEINEPLTGRKYEYLLLPLSFEELSNDLIKALSTMLENVFLRTRAIEVIRRLCYRVVNGFRP